MKLMNEINYFISKSKFFSSEFIKYDLLPNGEEFLNIKLFRGKTSKLLINFNIFIKAQLSLKKTWKSHQFPTCTER